eukprot:2919149-Lingulodinium_polyedra.AAC.1
MRHPAPRVVGQMNQKSAARSRGRSWVCVCARARVARSRSIKCTQGVACANDPPDLCTQGVACAKLPFRFAG